jgi:hypothetical protein
MLLWCDELPHLAATLAQPLPTQRQRVYASITKAASLHTEA